MVFVSVSRLKANLSRFLRDVARGTEIQITDRGEPVARLTRLTPVGSRADDRRRDDLIRSGILRAGTGRVRHLLAAAAPIDLPASIGEALAEGRDDRL